jgi:3'-phosphoadenosine 5'-phosphosulfate sulfotransferase (PAPS reductase)/FAD synthetase
MMDDGALMDKAVRILGEHRFYVLFSGGRDSLAALLWVMDNVRHDGWRIVYTEVTGNTSPYCTQYVEGIIGRLGLADKLVIDRQGRYEFFEVMRRAGIPILGYYRWCLKLFKEDVWKRYPGIQVLGIKRADSSRRRGVRPITEYRLTNSIGIHPIYNFSRGDVIDYIREHGVEVNPCYDRYGHSGNCMFCPYHRKAAIIKTMQDSYWREKILDALSHIRSNTRYVQSIKRKWTKFSTQTTLA